VDDKRVLEGAGGGQGSSWRWSSHVTSIHTIDLRQINVAEVLSIANGRGESLLLGEHCGEAILAEGQRVIVKNPERVKKWYLIE
jgi:hypothetical protein